MTWQYREKVFVYFQKISILTNRSDHARMLLLIGFSTGKSFKVVTTIMHIATTEIVTKRSYSVDVHVHACVCTCVCVCYYHSSRGSPKAWCDCCCFTHTHTNNRTAHRHRAAAEGAGDHQLPVREGSTEPALPRRARTAALPVRRGALHRLQALRGRLSRAGNQSSCHTVVSIKKFFIIIIACFFFVKCGRLT